MFAPRIGLVHLIAGFALRGRLLTRTALAFSNAGWSHASRTAREAASGDSSGISDGRPASFRHDAEFPITFDSLELRDRSG
jgi:hypothetical protein